MVSKSKKASSKHGKQKQKQKQAMKPVLRKPTKEFPTKVIGIGVAALAVILALQGPALFETSEFAEMRQRVRSQNPVQRVQSDDNWATLMKWFESKGARFPHVEVISYPGIDEHRGLEARRDLDRNELLMLIPHDFIITEKKVQESEIGQRIMNLPGFSDRDEGSVDLMSMFLLEERSKDDDSWWHPYIQTLPTEYRNVAINFNKEELAMLKGTTAGGLRRQEMADYKDSYKFICDNAADLCEKFSFSDFTWGRISVISRLFPLRVKGKNTMALMPYADMLNHSFEPQIEVSFNDEWDAATIGTQKAVKRGTEVYNSYGEKGNEKLLNHYGFALEENPFNEAGVHIEISGSDPLYQEKRDRTQDPDQSPSYMFVLSADPSSEGFQDVLKFCRLAVANEDELEVLEAGKGHRMFSLSNERRALLRLQAAADDALIQLPGSAEEDEELLKSSTLSFNQRNIIIARLGERRLLQKLVESMDDVVQLMDSASIDDLRKTRYLKKYKAYRKYFGEIIALRARQDSKLSQE